MPLINRGKNAESIVSRLVYKEQLLYNSSHERICLQILAKLEEQPDLYSQLRTFLRYYLPTTRKILDNRALIEQRGMMDEENAKAVCERTDRLLPEIRRAFQKQLDALNEHSYLDVEVEMDVLEGMMKGDGYTATQGQ